jgi:hypothetical protein
MMRSVRQKLRHAADRARWSACIFCSDWDLEIDKHATSPGPVGCGCDQANASNNKDQLAIVATDHDGAIQPVTVINKNEDHGAADRWPGRFWPSAARLQYHRLGRSKNKSGRFFKNGRFY